MREGIFGRRGAAHGSGSPFAPAKGKKRAPAKPRPLPLPIDEIDLPAGPRVIVEYPPAILSPNSRAHWSKRGPVARAYRKGCWALTLAAKIRAPAEGVIRLRLDFFPPDRVPRDDDNAIAAFKAGRDGIADALKVDDARFQIVPVWHVEPRSCVVVTILEAEPA
jgi:hypothetical protein